MTKMNEERYWLSPECRTEDQWPVISKRRHLAADDFFGLRRSGPDCLFEGFFRNRPYLIQDTCRVVINVFCWFFVEPLQSNFLILLTPSLHPQTCT